MKIFKLIQVQQLRNTEVSHIVFAMIVKRLLTVY